MSGFGGPARCCGCQLPRVTRSAKVDGVRFNCCGYGSGWTLELWNAGQPYLVLRWLGSPKR